MAREKDKSKPEAGIGEQGVEAAARIMKRLMAEQDRDPSGYIKRAHGVLAGLLTEEVARLRHVLGTSRDVSVPSPTRLVRKARRGPGVVFWAHLRAAEVRKTVEEIRQHLFGHRHPPFTNPTQGIEWVEHHLEPGGDTEKTLEQAVEIVIFGTGWSPIGTLAHLLWGEVPVGPPDPVIDYRGAPLFEDSPPGRAVWAGERLPIWIDVRLYPWHLDNATLRKILTLIRHYPGVEAIPTGKDAKLLDLMAVIGPPLGVGKGKSVGARSYYERLSKLWARTFRTKADPEALRKRWERLQKDHPHFVRALGVIRGGDES